MKKGKILDYIIFIPFLAALAFFIIFIRYYFVINGSSEVTSIMNLYLIRCRNMALFCLILGIILLIIKNILLFFKSNNTNNQVLETKTYSLNNESIVNNILKNKDINFEFIDSNIENRKMKFIDYNENYNSISLLDLEKEKRGNKFYDSRYFIKCCKCDEIISKNAEKCKYCGSVQNEIKTKKFNPVIFAVNMIIILLCIIVMVLTVHKIVEQRDINLSNINIKTVETK